MRNRSNPAFCHTRSGVASLEAAVIMALVLVPILALSLDFGFHAVAKSRADGWAVAVSEAVMTGSGDTESVVASATAEGCSCVVGNGTVSVACPTGGFRIFSPEKAEAVMEIR